MIEKRRHHHRAGLEATWPDGRSTYDVLDYRAFIGSVPIRM